MTQTGLPYFLGKRLHRHGLTLHPEKTRFVDFRFNNSDGSFPETDSTNRR